MTKVVSWPIGRMYPQWPLVPLDKMCTVCSTSSAYNFLIKLSLKYYHLVSTRGTEDPHYNYLLFRDYGGGSCVHGIGELHASRMILGVGASLTGY